MDIYKIIKNRRSIMPNLYNESPINEKELNKILEAANWAPTHRKTEPWRFKVFKKNSKQKLGDFLAGKYQETTQTFSKFRYEKIKEKINKSSVVIAICMQRDPKESIPEWEELASVSMAVQNLWLMSSSIGIGSYWSSPSLMNYLGEHITLKEGEKCLGFFYMGKYSVEIEPRTPGNFEDKIERFN
jgi:nitroreductase|tara:strand:+ start:4927 stop:5484 length:558 start_codon:yes stop_codon:yes gene_type:complete